MNFDMNFALHLLQADAVRAMQWLCDLSTVHTSAGEAEMRFY